MKEIAWKRDETPYLVFACDNCKQYTYANTTRKTKKCARCRHLNVIENVIENGELVNGISIAVEMVKLRQNELAIKELGTSPEFRTPDDFKISISIENDFAKNEKESVNEYRAKFNKVLKELYELYKEFPFYLIELNAEKYEIPLSEVKLLVRSYQKEGKLIETAKNMLTIRIY